MPPNELKRALSYWKTFYSKRGPGNDVKLSVLLTQTGTPGDLKERLKRLLPNFPQYWPLPDVEAAVEPSRSVGQQIMEVAKSSMDGVLRFLIGGTSGNDEPVVHREPVVPSLGDQEDHSPLLPHDADVNRSEVQAASLHPGMMRVPEDAVSLLPGSLAWTRQNQEEERLEAVEMSRSMSGRIMRGVKRVLSGGKGAPAVRSSKR